MSAALGVDPDDRIEDVEREIVDGPQPAAIALGGRSPPILDTGSKSDQDQAARLREALVFVRRRAGRTNISSVFLTDAERTPRKSVVTKKLCDNNPGIGRLFDAEAGRLDALIETPPRA